MVCPRAEHAGSRVRFDGTYGTWGHRRQRYKCVPANGDRPHVFTEPLPREETWRHSCDACERPVPRHEGPQAPRKHQFVSRGIAAALVAVGAGQSYMRASHVARSRARRHRIDGDTGAPRWSAHGQLVADWVEVFAPTASTAKPTTPRPSATGCSQTTAGPESGGGWLQTAWARPRCAERQSAPPRLQQRIEERVAVAKADAPLQPARHRPLGEVLRRHPTSGPAVPVLPQPVASLTATRPVINQAAPPVSGSPAVAALECRTRLPSHGPVQRRGPTSGARQQCDDERQRERSHTKGDGQLDLLAPRQTRSHPSSLWLAARHPATTGLVCPTRSERGGAATASLRSLPSAPGRGPPVRRRARDGPA